MPEEGIELIPRQQILTYEEIHLVARAAAALGITKLRLTGGEPLLRPELSKLVAMLAGIKGIEDISLTTNGVLLGRYAAELKNAGLHRINVSLDSLRPERFRRITRIGRLEDVLQGVKIAREVGLRPIKINVVAMRGSNDDEVIDFARKTIDEDWHVRFIELMPFSDTDKDRDNHSFVSADEIKGRIASLGPLEPVHSTGGGPAKYCRLPGAKGTIGFITAVSDHFCKGCNRLRLTSQGKLRPCLFSDEEIDLITPIRQGATIAEVRRLIEDAARCKPRGHRLASGVRCEQSMSRIGG